MKNKFSYIFFLCFFFVKLGASQDYAYKNYSTKDGLAGNHVYHMIQDKEGYLWFATETGVSRFDGKNFINYTVNEGLPTNEILKLFVDSKNRVWMMPFSNQICYYYKGKIFNSNNDSTIRKISINTIVADIIEDGDNNLIFEEATANLIGLSAANKVYHFKKMKADFYAIGLGDKKQPQIFLSQFNLHYIKQSTQLYDIKFKRDSIELVKVNKVYNFFGDKSSETYISPKLIITSNRHSEIEVSKKIIFQLNGFTETEIPKPPLFNNLFIKNDSVVFVNTKTGAYEYNFQHAKKINQYLTNENVTNCFIDNEKNVWFTTANHGIFKLYSNEILNFIWKDKSDYKQTITSVGGIGSNVFVGTNTGDFFKLEEVNKKIQAKKEMSIDFLKGMNQKIKYRQNKLIILDQMTFSVFEQGKISRVNILNQRHFSIKDFDIDKKGRLFIAYHSGACYGDLIRKGKQYQLSDYVFFFDYRTTSVAVGDSINYLGTLAGLKCFNAEGQMITSIPDFPLLKVSISNLTYKDGLLWIGTNQNGIICFDGKKIIKNITIQDGLPENSIRCMFIDKEKLWVGTNKGIAELTFDKLDNIKVARKLNVNEGLMSNVINDIYVLHDSIFVATDEGLSIVTGMPIDIKGPCILNIPVVKVGSNIVPLQKLSLLPGEDIQFEYDGISIKSEGDISYKYRLLGMDSMWRNTNQRLINFSFLPHGTYNFQLLAINKFGIQSKLISIPFTVNKRLYEENYFRVLVCLLILAMISFLFHKRNQLNKRKYLLKLQNAHKIMELEQEALKAQMNPHFIFNCLNAIQHFIFEKDVLSANKFISSFASLIRQALDNSGKKNISIEEEINFLKSYIEIEQNRFEDRFLYEINVASDIETSMLQIPPMLVQPFVENAINHGLLHKKNGIGNLIISFSTFEKMLKINISDNGIGRTASKSFSHHVELTHVSKGIALTEMRIGRLNYAEPNKIKLKIGDLYDSIGSSIGTEVELLIPLMLNN